MEVVRKKIVYWFLKFFLTKSEKCMFVQALDLQKDEVRKDWLNGHGSFFREDIAEIDFFISALKTKLWSCSSGYPKIKEMSFFQKRKYNKLLKKLNGSSN